MESYEYQTQQFASPTNHYGFCNYTNQHHFQFNYNQLSNNNNNNNNNNESLHFNTSTYNGINSYSSHSATSSNYSPSNSLFSPINQATNYNYEPNQSYSVSSLAKSYHSNQSESPKSNNNTNSSFLSANYTPTISHYQPTNYSDTYTSTPHNSIINKSEFKISSSMKRKDSTSENTKSHKRPKVIKLDIKQTNIGFGPIEYNPVYSNDSITSSKLFQCTECSASFTIAAKLFMHQHKHHKNRSSNECPICYKKFNSPANALVHLRAHTQEKTYKCDECSLAFCDSSTLKKHIRTHTGEKPYECQLCFKRFAQSGNLKRHLSVHDKYDSIQRVSPKTSPAQELESSNVPEQNVSAFTQPNYSLYNSEQYLYNTTPHGFTNYSYY